MARPVLQMIEAAVNRRAFLRKTMSATAAFATSLCGIGMAKTAHAGGVGCCGLCKVPGTCMYTDCACEWTWTCCKPYQQHVNPEWWQCDECFEQPVEPCTLPCEDMCECFTCIGVKCSRATLLGTGYCEAYLGGC